MGGGAYGQIVRDWFDAHPAKMPHAQALADVLDEAGDRQQPLSRRLHFERQGDEFHGHLNEARVLSARWAGKIKPPDVRAFPVTRDRRESSLTG